MRPAQRPPQRGSDVASCNTAPRGRAAFPVNRMMASHLVPRTPFLRSNFGSSRLVRLLGKGVPAVAEAPGMDFAERLSLRLNAFDAMDLQWAHQSIRSTQPPPPAQPAVGRP